LKYSKITETPKTEALLLGCDAVAFLPTSTQTSDIECLLIFLFKSEEIFRQNLSVEVAIRGFKIAPANTTEIVHRRTFKQVYPQFSLALHVTYHINLHVFPHVYN